MDIHFENGTFMLGDCLERMRELPDASVDMVLCDLPYGTTQNKWDAVIPFAPLWAEYWRVAKPGAAVVLTAAQPFTSALIMSQVDLFRYEWIWRKTRVTGNLTAKLRPMLAHETVCVFAKQKTTYYPYTDIKNPLAGIRTPVSKSENYNSPSQRDDYVRPELLTKLSVIDGFDVGKDRGMHPTQKPVTLFEYLIRTYTNLGMTVLDNCAGSGTTAIAAERTGRRWFCIERDRTYFDKAVERVLAEVAAKGLFA